VAQRGALVFNEDDNRFEWQNANTGTGATSARNLRTSRLTTGTMFNWENPDYRLVYMGNMTHTAGFAVVKNVATGQFEYLRMNFSSINTEPPQIGYGIFPGGLDLESVRFFAHHNGLPYLFCVSDDDKLYRVNVNAMQQWDDVTSQVLPAGHRFSNVKNSAIRFDRKNLIVVCTYDPNGEAGKNGQLALYNVQDGTGNLNLAKHPTSPTAAGYQIDMKWGGFGKIIAVDYKHVP
jgi:hypothetical protein